VSKRIQMCVSSLTVPSKSIQILENLTFKTNSDDEFVHLFCISCLIFPFFAFGVLWSLMMMMMMVLQ